MLVVTISSTAVFSLPMTTMHHIDRAVELDMQKGIDRGISEQIGTATVATISTVRTALRTIFLSKKTATTVPTGTSVNI